jgi:hypothetical protein
MANEPETDTEPRYGSAYWRALPDGEREITVYPMLFGKANVCISYRGSTGIEDAWCYPTLHTAIAAAEAWDGNGDPPNGWTRNPSTGRRRDNGDPSTEYIRW